MAVADGQQKRAGDQTIRLSVQALSYNLRLYIPVAAFIVFHNKNNKLNVTEPAAPPVRPMDGVRGDARETPMSRRMISILAAATMGFCLMSQTASAENRVALVIGNSAYRSVGKLENPVNDATAMTQVLSSAGFEVISASNLTQSDMRRAISEFSTKVSQKGEDTVALVFYAGHGLQVEGENFLVPVDARIEREADVSNETLRLADLMKALESAPVRTRIVILDACRNNPFTIQKSTGRGLAIVDAPTGSIVAYATAPGSEALDGTGINSPYSAALVEAMKEPGLQLEQLFKRVRLSVHKTTDGRQTPWESSSLTSNFAFFNAANTAVAAASPESEKPVVVASLDPQAAPIVRTSRLEQIRSLPVERAYDVVIEEDAVEYYEEFVRLYPTHPFCDRVRRLLFRRNQMVAWRNATVTNTADAYSAYLSRYPNSDHAASAIRLQVQPRLRAIDPIIARLPNQSSQGNGQLGNNRPGGLPFPGQNNGAGQNNNGRPGGIPLPGQNNGTGQANNGKPGGIPLPGQNNGAGQANNGKPGGIQIPNGTATLPTPNNGAGQANNGRPGNLPLPNGTATLPTPNNGAGQANNGKPGGIQLPNGTATLPTPNNGAGQANNGRPGGIQLPNGTATLPTPNNGAGQANNGKPGGIQLPSGTATLPNANTAPSRITTIPAGGVQLPSQNAGTTTLPNANTAPSRITTIPAGGVQLPSQNANNAPSRITTVPAGGVQLPSQNANNVPSRITTVPPAIQTPTPSGIGRVQAGGLTPNPAINNAPPANRIVTGPATAQPRFTAPVAQPRLTAPVAQPRFTAPAPQQRLAPASAGANRQFSGGLGRRI
jgi:hypothetical protein